MSRLLRGHWGSLICIGVAIGTTAAVRAIAGEPDLDAAIIGGALTGSVFWWLTASRR